MTENTKFEDLSRNDQISCFIQIIDGHEHETEIEIILTILTVFNLSIGTAKQYNLLRFDSIELIIWILNALNSGRFEDEEKAWILILDSLGTQKIFRVVKNNEFYINPFIRS